jgi:competence protein ComEA
MDKKRWIIVSIIGIFLLVSVIFYVFDPKTKPEASPFPSYPKQESLPKEKNEGPNLKSSAGIQIWVDIKGAVAKPGVYQLSPEKARMFELIQLSGGLLPAADERNVNLAQTLHDGEMVMIYKKGEMPLFPQTNGSMTAAVSKDQPQDGTIIHINTATLEQLDSLPGIGTAKASAILDYRKEHGFFRNIDELRRVKGISEKLFEKIKGKISLQ